MNGVLIGILIVAVLILLVSRLKDPQSDGKMYKNIDMKPLDIIPGFTDVLPPPNKGEQVRK